MFYKCFFAFKIAIKSAKIRTLRNFFACKRTIRTFVYLQNDFKTLFFFYSVVYCLFAEVVLYCLLEGYLTPSPVILFLNIPPYLGAAAFLTPFQKSAYGENFFLKF